MLGDVNTFICIFFLLACFFLGEQVDRNSERLLEQTIHEVNTEFEMMQRKYPTVRYWQPGGMEVTFCNEPGEGAGVRRSFFTAISEVRTYVCKGEIPQSACITYVRTIQCVY